MTENAAPKSTKNLFGIETNPSHVMPAKLSLDSRFKFRCYPGVGCFTACCGNINITLTPFDILRLRRHLNMAAPEFLHQYTVPQYLEKTDMPGVKIKLNEQGRCPFVTPDGCTVYPSRPTTCRYYPVGMANFHERPDDEKTEDARDEQFFFLVKEPHCKGHEEAKEWSIREWREDQGVDICDEMNRDWMALVMRRKSFGIQATLSEKAQRMFFMASTDLDQFRRFVLESSFLDTYEVDPEELERIREDDVALMKFSFRYLASSLFGTNDLTIKQEKIKVKAAEIKKKQAEAEKNADSTYEELKALRDNMLAELSGKQKKR